MALRGVVGIGLAVVAAVWLTAVPAEAQALASAPSVKPEAAVGAWEGVSKGTNGEVPVKMELLFAAGKFTGTIGAPGMIIPIVDGKLEGDVLSLTMDVDGMSGTMAGKLDGSKLEATWVVGSESGSASLVKSATAAAATDTGSVAGEWAGEAMVQDQPMAIMLHLKLDGDVVTGEMESAAGRVPLTSGSWKDGTLTLTFPYSGGEPVMMGGKLQDGKLAGVFDYNSGEVQGTWWAARK